MMKIICSVLFLVAFCWGKKVEPSKGGMLLVIILYKYIKYPFINLYVFSQYIFFSLGTG